MTAFQKFGLAVLVLTVGGFCFVMFAGSIANGSGLLFNARIAIDWVMGKIFMILLIAAVVTFVFKK